MVEKTTDNQITVLCRVRMIYLPMLANVMLATYIGKNLLSSELLFSSCWHWLLLSVYL